MDEEILEKVILYLLVCGTYISYFLQFFKIYKCRSVNGINEYMLIMGLLSSLFSFYSYILMYKTYSCDFILQLTSPYVCSIILYFMFYIYINDEKCKKRYVNISIIHGIILCFMLLSVILDFNRNINGIIFSIFSVIFSILMWLPQIKTTIDKNDCGALSIPMIFIHSIGCLIAVIFEIVFMKSSFYIPLTFIVSFVLEFYLFIICCYYEYKKYDIKHMEDYHSIN